MKVKLAIGLGSLAVIAALFFANRNNEAKPSLRSPRKETDALQFPKADAHEEDELEKEAIKKAISEAKLPADYVPTREERDTIISKARAREMSPAEEELGIMFATPVEFYVQVLDQFDSPVIGAGIRCTWGESEFKLQAERTTRWSRGAGFPANPIRC